VQYFPLQSRMNVDLTLQNIALGRVKGIMDWETPALFSFT